MGCGASAIDRETLLSTDNPANSGSPRTITSIQELLSVNVKNPDFRTKLRNFIVNTWTPQAGDSQFFVFFPH